WAPTAGRRSSCSCWGRWSRCWPSRGSRRSRAPPWRRQTRRTWRAEPRGVGDIQACSPGAGPFRGRPVERMHRDGRLPANARDRPVRAGPAGEGRLADGRGRPEGVAPGRGTMAFGFPAYHREEHAYDNCTRDDLMDAALDALDQLRWGGDAVGEWRIVGSTGV